MLRRYNFQDLWGTMFIFGSTAITVKYDAMLQTFERTHLERGKNSPKCHMSLLLDFTSLVTLELGCVCVCVNTCVGVIDWLVACFHQLSSVLFLLRQQNWVGEFCSIFQRRLFSLSFPCSWSATLTTHCQTHSPRSPWHFSYVTTERVVARLLAACLYTWVNKAQLILFGHNV